MNIKRSEEDKNELGTSLCKPDQNNKIVSFSNKISKTVMMSLGMVAVLVLMVLLSNNPYYNNREFISQWGNKENEPLKTSSSRKMASLSEATTSTTSKEKDSLSCFAPTEAAAEDLVTWLPGWSDGELPSCQYSGFIEVNNLNDGYNYMVHYYLVESENDPLLDPLIVWTNGGPGASSMFGMMTEVGPFTLNEESFTTEEYKRTGVPTLFPNEYSWSKMGNIVIFDWPPPVGFSYCNGNVTGNGDSCGEWDDERMAKVSFAALEGLLEERFPNYILQNNPLFLTGESYAGVYVPKLAQQILNNFKPWNFVGLAVGDGCVGTDVVCGPKLDIGIYGPWFDYLFLYGHGQFSMKLWDDLVDNCGVNHLKYTTQPPINTESCNEAQSKVSKQVGGFFEYNLYDTCTYSEDFLGTARQIKQSSLYMHAQRKIVNRMLQIPTTFEKQFILPKLLLQSDGGAVNDYKCGGGYAQSQWTDHPDVRQALHVDVNSNFFSGDNGEGMTYHLTEKNLLPFYYHIITNSHLKVMIYNGDTDPGLNTFVAQNWTSALNIPLDEDWRPWTTDNCQYMGGSITKYADDFNFVTVRGSGHMVPNNKPLVTFEMMNNFVSGREFKVFNASCDFPSFDGSNLEVS